MAVASLLMSGVAVAADTWTSYEPGTEPFDFHSVVVDDSAGYVFLSSAAGLEVRDLSGSVVSSALTIADPYGLALSPDGATLYVADSDAHAIDIVDTETLTETAQIQTPSSISPQTLALAGGKLWFGYPQALGTSDLPIGVVDLSSDVPVVTVPVAVTNTIGPAISWTSGYAPVLTASTALPGALFVASTGSSPGPVARYTTTASGLTESAYTLSGGNVQQLAVSKDGTQLFAALLSSFATRFSTSDLATLGRLEYGGGAAAVAIAPDDGRLALGESSGNDPAVYTLDASLDFVSQYDYQNGWSVPPGGVAFSADGGTIYLVTQSWATTGGAGWQFQFHVISGTHSAAPPAVSDLSVVPDYRSVGLRWAWEGQYDPSTTTSYNIERGTAPDQMAPYAEVTSNRSGSQTWTDADVQPGVRYYYRVSAQNTAGTGEWSPTSSAVRNERVVVFVGGASYTAPTEASADIAYLSDGGPTHVITSTRGQYSDPAVSPDGTEVAYAATSGTRQSLWLTSMDGTSTRQITSGADLDSQPSWSPDGSTIAFTRTIGATSSIWTVPSKGGSATQIPGSGGDSQPAWAPSGNILAVTAGSGAGRHIAIINLQGGYTRALVGTNGDLPSDRCFSTPGTNRPLCHYSGSAASWSPDGSQIVYVQTNAGGTSIALVPAAGGAIDFRLWVAFGNYDRIAWSPDGELVLTRQAYDGSTYISEEASDGTGDATLVRGGSTAGTAVGTASATAPGPLYRSLTTPGSVTGLAAVPGYHMQTLTWAAGSDTAYVVVRRSEAGGSAPTSPTDGVAVYSGPASTATATGLVTGAAYAFAVFPYSAVGDAGQPTSVSVTSTVGPPPTPAPTPTPTPTPVPVLKQTGPVVRGSMVAGSVVHAVLPAVAGAPTKAKTTTTWYVNGKKVGTGDKLKLKAKWGGKKLTFKVTTTWRVGHHKHKVTRTSHPKKIKQDNARD